MQATHGGDEQGLGRAERFLADVGNLLATSLDYEDTLEGVARFALHSLADFCVIDILEDGEVKRLRAAHRDPAKAELAGALMRFPVDRRLPHPSLRALETGKPQLVPEVTEAVAAAVTQGEEHLRAFQALEPRSLIAAPLLGRDRVLGVVLFGSSSRRYDERDAGLAGRLVRLAGLEVDNARLYREAQRAIQARDRVLGIVAHDLRNPLSVIDMSAQLLLEDGEGGRRENRPAQMILRSAQRMDRLIQDLLDVARIEADRLYLQEEVHEPAALAGEAVELGVPLAASRSLSLHFEACGELPGILADRDRILQVLGNLIGNAIRFTAPGGRIDVEVSALDDRVHFTVTDTGAGIPPEHLPHLFQPFWQSEQGRLDGAGLGLMIARGIVEAHGGRIWAESTPGEGSTFHFTVPALAPVAHGDRRVGPADRRVAEPVVAAPVRGRRSRGAHAAQPRGPRGCAPLPGKRGGGCHARAEEPLDPDRQ